MKVLPLNSVKYILAKGKISHVSNLSFCTDSFQKSSATKASETVTFNHLAYKPFLLTASLNNEVDR